MNIFLNSFQFKSSKFLITFLRAISKKINAVIKLTKYRIMSLINMYYILW